MIRKTITEANLPHSLRYESSFCKVYCLHCPRYDSFVDLFNEDYSTWLPEDPCHEVRLRAVCPRSAEVCMIRMENEGILNSYSFPFPYYVLHLPVLMDGGYM